MKAKRILSLALGSAMGLLLVFAAQAETFPSKPVVLVCQFAAGGSTDVLARAIANSTRKFLGQPVVVENKPGASGTIGTDSVLKSKPDGYTLLTTSTGNFTTTPLMQGAPYDPNNDVTHIINIATHPILLVVNSDSPWKTLDQFIAAAKKDPGKIKYGQNSPGGTTHMAMESFRKAAKLDMKMIPYGGGASEVVAALLGKHVDCGVMHPQEAGVYIKDGKFRALVVFSKKRLKSYPTVPTAVEKKLNVVIGVTKGVCGPKGMPADVVKKLHDSFKKVMTDKDFLEVAKKTGDAEFLDYMNGPDTAKFLQNMYKEMAPLITELGLVKKK